MLITTCSAAALFLSVKQENTIRPRNYCPYTEGFHRLPSELLNRWSRISEPYLYFQPYLLLSSLTNPHLILQGSQCQPPDLCLCRSLWNLSYSCPELTPPGRPGPHNAPAALWAFAVLTTSRYNCSLDCPLIFPGYLEIPWAKGPCLTHLCLPPTSLQQRL